MDFVALLSGGKDSCYNTFQCTQHGHRLVCLAHLRPTPLDGADGEETNSFMYQTAGSTVLKAYEECFGVPMVQRQILGGSVNTSLEYNEVCVGDEVEDLYELLKNVQQQYPTVKAVACGAILSNYQRHRLEHVCGRLGLTVLSYLWQKDRKELLQEMILEHNMDIMLVKVAGAGLQPRKHLGKKLKDLYPNLLTLHKKYGLDLCGEGGEYESLVLDAPYFLKRIEIISSKVIEDPEDPEVGNLYILEHRVVDKDLPDIHENANSTQVYPYPTFPTSSQKLNECLKESFVCDRLEEGSQQQTQPLVRKIVNMYQPVRIHWKADGFGHSELIIPRTYTSLSSAQSLEFIYRSQVKEIMDRLVMTLANSNVEVQKEDIVFVHLYLQDMSMFATVNEVYCTYFGRYPPSRSCVQLALPVGLCVAVEVCILRQSYHSMLHPANPLLQTTIPREVLHVQSMSQWAPLCIGPYCQANILKQFFLFIAGQIPLQPGTMTLRPHNSSCLSLEDLMLDLTLSLRHVHRVLSVLQSDLHHLLSVIVYVNLSQAQALYENEDSDLSASIQSLITQLCRQNQFVGDSGVAIVEEKVRKRQALKKGQRNDNENGEEEEESDSFNKEDNENDQEEDFPSDIHVPTILVIGVPGLPRNASCEIEAVAAKQDRIRPSGWKTVSVNAKLMVQEKTASKSNANESSQSATIDLDDWPIWSDNSTSFCSSFSINSPSLQGYIKAKTYPGTLCSGLIDVFSSAPTVDIGEIQSSFSLVDVVCTAKDLLQLSLRQYAAMRTNRLLFVKLLYDPSLVGNNFQPHEMVTLWHEQWQQRQEEKQFAVDEELEKDAGQQRSVKLTRDEDKTKPTEDSPVASVIALPVHYLSSNTMVHQPVFKVFFLATDAQQLEAEAWIKLATNHCQGS